MVTITYYPEGAGRIVAEPLTVKANSRHTVFVNHHARPDLSLCARVIADRNIICERPMYFSYGPSGWTGGHDVLGYAP